MKCCNGNLQGNCYNQHLEAIQNEYNKLGGHRRVAELLVLEVKVQPVWNVFVTWAVGLHSCGLYNDSMVDDLEKTLENHKKELNIEKQGKVVRGP